MLVIISLTLFIVILRDPPNTIPICGYDWLIFKVSHFKISTRPKKSYSYATFPCGFTCLVSYTLFNLCMVPSSGFSVDTFPFFTFPSSQQCAWSQRTAWCYRVQKAKSFRGVPRCAMFFSQLVSHDSRSFPLAQWRKHERGEGSVQTSIFLNHKQHFSANVRQSCFCVCFYTVILWFQGLLSFWSVTCGRCFFRGRQALF